MYRRILLFTLALPLTFAATINYSYDPAGRLTRIDYGASGAIVYSYDKAGNLLSRDVVAGSTAASGTNRVSPTTPATSVKSEAPKRLPLANKVKEESK